MLTNPVQFQSDTLSPRLFTARRGGAKASIKLFQSCCAIVQNDGYNQEKKTKKMIDEDGLVKKMK